MASLQYTFIFLLMVTEVVIFGLLLIPLPVTWRKNMFNVLSKSVMVKKALFYVKIMYSFVFFMFVDAVLKLYKIHQREDTDTILDERMIAQLRMSKFYAQRNFYLTGFTLLLGLIFINTYGLLNNLVAAKDEAHELRKSMSSKSASGAVDKNRLQQLEQELKERKRQELDFETLKKQLKSAQTEYDRLSEEHVKLEKKLAAAGSSGKQAGGKKDN